MQQLCSADPVGAPKLVEEIVEKAQGVFLWVILVARSLLNGLRNGDSIVYLRKRLQEIPSEIKALYGYMLSKVESIYYDEGRRLFALVWLAFYREKEYNGVGISAVNLFFAIGEEHELTHSYMRWDKKKVASAVQWVESRFKICCAGMMEISSQIEWDFEGMCLTTLGNRSVQYIHRTARDFLISEQSQQTPNWFHPVTADQIFVRMMRANTMYLKCVRSIEGKVSTGDFLTPFIQRTMWLAYKSEQEPSQDHVQILDAFQDAAKLLFDIDYGWDKIVDDYIMEFDALNASIRHIRGHIGWFDDFLCVAILWKLGRYVEKKFRDGKKVHKTERPYLDYALRYMREQGHPAELWDLRTISALLEHGSSSNQYYSLGVGTSTLYLRQSTPWQAMLYASNHYNYTERDEHFSSLLAPLLELMLRHGADPEAVASDSRHSWTVKDVICPYLETFPEKATHLLKLLETLAIKPPPKASRLSRLKKRLQASK